MLERRPGRVRWTAGERMDPTLERQMRGVLAGERFGVLATLQGGRLHTATIHFAETDELELVHAIRPATLKAQQAMVNPRVAFQVDNRGVLNESRERFTRVSFEGTLRLVPEDHPDYGDYHRTFAAKLPVGERLLAHPEIAMYVLRPSVVRLAIGAAPAEDVTVTYELDQDDAIRTGGDITARDDYAWRSSAAGGAEAPRDA
jgi:nitroimidazol reductase NimA-like FMN-containing flavoprotein (pyridoxamine 5'-phosphate oxidase superfamily)